MMFNTWLVGWLQLDTTGDIQRLVGYSLILLVMFNIWLVTV